MNTNNDSKSLINFLMITDSNRNEVIRDIYECSIDEQNYGPKDNSFYVCKKYIEESEKALERAIQMEHELLGIGE